jgi:hypothetical protein
MTDVQGLVQAQTALGIELIAKAAKAEDALAATRATLAEHVDENLALHARCAKLEAKLTAMERSHDATDALADARALLGEAYQHMPVRLVQWYRDCKAWLAANPESPRAAADPLECEKCGGWPRNDHHCKPRAAAERAHCAEHAGWRSDCERCHIENGELTERR